MSCSSVSSRFLVYGVVLSLQVLAVPATSIHGQVRLDDPEIERRKDQQRIMVLIKDGGLPEELAKKTHRAIEQGLRYLLAAQGSDGGWQAFDKSHPAITAMVIKALAQSDTHGPNHPAVKRGLDFLLKYVQPDGGIYVTDEGQPNYHTSVALMALASIKDPGQKDRIRQAQAFLKKLQWDEGEGHETSSSWYGGAGYGRSKRPDLSNTQLMLEALHESGLPADDPVYQKALVFISRSQLLDASNDQDFAKDSTDGGFVYTPANNGESMAGTESVDGQSRLRSYGSMTYAGFKSMLYARVDKEDPRVQAAVQWIQTNYTLEQNPNMPAEQANQGLYYYYHVFARALKAWGRPTLVDQDEKPRTWREDLCAKLCQLQRDDGSWVNEADRWFEGNPHLVTAYAVLALQTAMEP